MDARVDEHIAEVGDEVAEELDGGGHHQHRHKDRVVVAHECVQRQLSHPGDLEEGLDNHRAGKEHAQHPAKARGNRDERITQRVAPNCPTPLGALGEHGAHIIRAHLLHQRVLHHNRQQREGGHHIGNHRQDHVVRAVAEERPTARSRRGIALKAADWEDVPESIDRAAQAHLEDHAHRKGGNGVG